MANKKTGYKVSFTQVLYNGKTERKKTVITYSTKRDAQKYANQLNEKSYQSTKNARVVKA